MKDAVKKKKAKRFSVYLPADVFEEIEILRKKVVRPRNFLFVSSLLLLLQLVDKTDRLKFEALVADLYKTEEKGK